MRPQKKQPLSVAQLYKSRRFRLNLLGFIIFHVFFYCFIAFGHNLTQFRGEDYVINSHHYVQDVRATSRSSFSLRDGLSPYDAQFFLKIADTGYTHRPILYSLNDKTQLDAAAYAFAPAYPLTVAFTHLFIGSIVTSAFITSLATLLLAFVMVYWLAAKWYDERLATRAAWLMFLYPFSIFYRAYFAEGLFLILLVVLMDALSSKRWLRGALSAGWLVVTRFVGLVGVAVLAEALIIERQRKRISASKVVKMLALALVPFLLFILLCYHQTGNPFYFISIRSLWGNAYPGALSFIVNVAFFRQSNWLDFHFSRLDVVSVVLFAVLIYKSRTWLPRYWWHLAVLLWLFPFLTHDNMSASRFQIVNLPIFIYAAHLLDRWRYLAVVTASTVGLAAVAIYFVNWHWIG